MRSSATTAFRAFTMLACAVGITAAAMSGTSWSEILDKFRNLDWPPMLTSASASTQGINGETGRSAPPCPSVERRMAGPPETGSRKDAAAPDEPAEAASAVPDVPMGFDDIQLRLRELGASYYLLESWGSQRQLYRFSCKMAVGDNADFTRYFEAADADPLQAMLRVLGQVETWRKE
ncbi:MAG: hypothetical protein KKA28_17560 [Planctomycetes bacterium]|nr:hypothetical protein [Planctomycetota bacterium]MCG2685070.1 hypothetical protein [Planctomycetales bacterium]